MSQRATFQELWPILIVTAPEHSTVESIRYFCERQDEYFKRRQRFATIHDMTKMKSMLDAKARKVMADWTKDREIDIGRWHIASATVTDSALIRGVITAVHWISKPKTPQLVTGSMHEALTYVIEHVKRDGLELGPELREHARTLSIAI